MLGRRERSLRKLKEGERVVDSTSKKNLSSFVFLGLRIKALVGNTGSSLPFALPNHNCNISSIISPKKKTLGSASHKKTSFVVKAASTPPVKQGANRPLWFASSQSLAYLDGSLPRDYGFDSLGLSDPEGTGGFIEPRWLAYGEIINWWNVLTSLKFH